MNMKQPNIIYIHCHDAGRYVEPYGYAVPMPHLQNLAESGVVFRNALCMDRLPVREQLYDLIMDPMERVNLAEETQYQVVLDHMRARLERWMLETDDPFAKGIAPGAGPNVSP